MYVTCTLCFYGSLRYECMYMLPSIPNPGDVLPAISSILGLDGPALEALAASTTQQATPVVSTSLPAPISLPTPATSADQNTTAGKKIASTNTQDKGQCVLVDLYSAWDQLSQLFQV